MLVPKSCTEYSTVVAKKFFIRRQNLLLAICKKNNNREGVGASHQTGFFACFGQSFFAMEEEGV